MTTSACGVIFDVDGVLVDSYEAHLASWQRVAARFGETITPDQFAATFGRTSRDIIRARWPRQATDPGQLQALDDLKESIFRELIVHPFPAMPGATALIEALSEAGFRIAVGSSAPPENVQLVLEQVDPHSRVAAVVTGRDVTRGKPDPQVFLLAADRLQLAPADCLVVEDAPAGIEAAHAAGMRCIGLASRGRTRQELAAADLCIDSLTALSPDVFRRLLTRAGLPASGGGPAAS